MDDCLRCPCFDTTCYDYRGRDPNPGPCEIRKEYEMNQNHETKTLCHCGEDAADGLHCEECLTHVAGEA